MPRVVVKFQAAHLAITEDVSKRVYFYLAFDMRDKAEAVFFN